MRKLKRIYYDTANSWNGEKSLAYNLKIYNVIRPELRDRAYEIYTDENLANELFEEISFLIDDFTAANKYAYTAGFNGRQGGYLVLYKSSRVVNYDSQGNASARLNTSMIGLDEKDVPGDVKRRFAKLARDIVKTAEAYCRKPIETETITIKREIKTFGE